MTSLGDVTAEVIACRRCPRLVAWREGVAVDPPARFRGASYWARPVPGFGDARARLIVVGLAPAAHGANRTGRMFTGDRSGEWLYRALHRAGYASRPDSIASDDGLRLRDCWVTAVVRCAPPGNRPAPAERDACLGFLESELTALTRARAILALGGFAWDGVLRAARALGVPLPSPAPRFGHGRSARLGDRWTIVGSYHPSQQNTFTGRLTETMLDEAVGAARAATGA